MAHTPGPWEQHSEYPDRIVVNGSCVYEVRDMTTEGGPPCVMDVALMAAAPELLSALKAHLPWDEDYGPVQGWGIWKDAVDAINKAEGRGE